MRFSRQGYWSGLPFPSPGDLYNSGIEPRSPTLQADSLLTELPGEVILFNITIPENTNKKQYLNIIIFEVLID